MLQEINIVESVYAFRIDIGSMEGRNVGGDIYDLHESRIKINVSKLAKFQEPIIIVPGHDFFSGLCISPISPIHCATSLREFHFFQHYQIQAYHSEFILF